MLGVLRTNFDVVTEVYVGSSRVNVTLSLRATRVPRYVVISLQYRMSNLARSALSTSYLSRP